MLNPLSAPGWKTGISISLRGIASSADYIESFRVTENGPGPGEVHGKGSVIGPAPPVIESGGKHV